MVRNKRTSLNILLLFVINDLIAFAKKYELPREIQISNSQFSFSVAWLSVSSSNV